MNLHDFSYELPPELIAQDPLTHRDRSRLMLMNKETGAVKHDVFHHITHYLKKGDCLVINNTKVIPARLFGARPGKEEQIEILLLTRKQDDIWECLVKPGRKVKPGVTLEFGGGLLKAECVSVNEDGNRQVQFTYDGIFEEILDELGQMPLPPYITHKLKDKNRYQTVYAKHDGSAAAPTAGLHFTPELLAKIEEMGVKIAPVTLHVGLGTFRPVKVENILEHHMHSEYYSISQESADMINETKKNGGRVICVGTTSCRTIESAADENGMLKESSGWTEIFIYPGYRFKVLDCLITNFHLPESTLLMLISALAGRENVLAAYEVAVRERYRFFSFGDAMFITNDTEGEYNVAPLDKSVDATVTVPGSKSMTNRALLMAALSAGEAKLKGVLFSDDSRYFLSSLCSLGFSVEENEETKEVILQGCGGVLPQKEGEIYVGSAGTAARFLTAMLALSEGHFTIQASEQMKKRPMKPLFEALEALGAEFTYLEQPWHLPVEVIGNPQACGTVQLDISESTQFLSALLMTAPMLVNGLKIQITSKKKIGSYIKITMKMMEQFGVNVDFENDAYEVKCDSVYRCDEYQIEPDVSAACYFYALAQLTGGKVIVSNVHFDSMQGDMKFLGVLKEMGAEVVATDAGICVSGPQNGNFDGIEIDMNDFSDQTMTLAAIAPFAKTPTTIKNIGHIRLQESDRLRAIAENLDRMQIRFDEGANCITIYPGEPQACAIETYEDHRMAMAFALVGLKVPEICIKNPTCCRKTFENYFDVLDEIR
ncbi:MAG: tRNA preQ1(34) S-adenosylmethionine ribosyltransferase-isomerase QueA [Lachnospiraceae bacterium]|nr:tRNA preQ1(34) S-adenosylmethionine ribosyltransferase-isomerase QueA [Lachnospiraceae bacterium]